MAGPFYNPQAGMGIEAAGASAVVSPVAPVRTSGADAVTAGLNLATKGVALYGQYQKSQGGSGGSNKPDPNLARFSEELDKVQQIRETQGENAARIAERQVGTNFAEVGIAFDQDFQRVYQQKTGKNYNLYGKDEEAAYRDEMLKDPGVQSNITASYAILGPNATFEERANWSINQDAVVKAAALTVDRAQAEATLTWNQKPADGTTSPREAYDTVLDNFTSISLGAFERKVKSGQTVTAQDIANSRAQFAQVSASLSRPAGLTGTDGDAQWKVFTEKTDKIKAMYDALENATSSKVLQETMTQYLANAINKSTDITDINKAITTIAIIRGDPLVLQQLGGSFSATAEALSKVNLDISKDSSSMFAFNLGSTPGLGGPPATGAPGPFVIDPKIKAKVSGKTPQEVVDDIRGSAAFAKVFDPKSMDNRENHEPFRNMASTIAAVMHSDNQENFLSPEFIAANITNPKMIATLRAYAAKDQDLGARLLGGYGEGLQLEKLRQTYNLQSIEGSDLGKYVKFDESTKTYVLNETGFAKEGGGFTEVMQKNLGAFQATLRDEYNNNLSEAAKDGFKKFYQVSGGWISSDVGNPLNIIAQSGIRSLTSAVKRREAIAALDKGISDLSLETGQPMDQAPPPPPAVVQPADQGIDISPRPTDQGIDISPRPTDEEDGRSLLQRVKEFLVSPAAAAELTPEQRAQLEAATKRIPPVRPPGLEYPIFVRNDKTFDLDSKKFETYPTAFTQTSLNEDDTPKGQRFEPHIDNVNIFTLGGGVTNLKNVKWAGEDKYGFEKDKFYNKNQIQNKIEANSGSKGEILKGLDTSKAVETTSGLSREQFGDNKSFAYAVYKGYEDRLTDKLKNYDLDTSKLNKNVSAALTDYFWNVEEFFSTKNSSGVRIAKAYIDGDENWYKKAWEGTSAMLDNILADGTPMLGLAKRRAIHYNMMGPPEGKGITKITLDGYNLNYIAEDGSTLYTRTDDKKRKITSKQSTLDGVAKAIQAARPTLPSGRPEDTFAGNQGAAINITPRPKN